MHGIWGVIVGDLSNTEAIEKSEKPLKKKNEEGKMNIKKGFLIGGGLILASYSLHITSLGIMWGFGLAVVAGVLIALGLVMD